MGVSRSATTRRQTSCELPASYCSWKRCEKSSPIVLVSSLEWTGQLLLAGIKGKRVVERLLVDAQANAVAHGRDEFGVDADARLIVEAGQRIGVQRLGRGGHVAH